MPQPLEDAMLDIAAISASSLSAAARLDDIEERLNVELPFVAINQSILTESCELEVQRSRGYSERMLGHIRSASFRSDLDTFSLAGGGRSLRMSDLPEAMRTSPTVQDFILPEGFRDGVTTPLVGRDGRLVGFQHLSFEEQGHLGDEVRDFLDRISRIVAQLVDPVGHPSKAGPRGWALMDDQGGLVRSAGQLAEGLTSLDIASRAIRVADADQSSWLVEVEGQFHHVGLCLTPHGIRIADMGPANPPLTERELQVAALLPQGLHNAQIADLLGITPRTANAHVAAILAKLDVMTRAAAAARIVMSGWRLL